jgi:hypothetical protein
LFIDRPPVRQHLLLEEEEPDVTVELDERTPQKRWIARVGGGEFGENYFVLPVDPARQYPHLSVSYTLKGEALTWGDAHYSRSFDDSNRLSYRWEGGGVGVRARDTRDRPRGGAGKRDASHRPNDGRVVRDIERILVTPHRSSHG